MQILLQICTSVICTLTFTFIIGSTPGNGNKSFLQRSLSSTSTHVAHTHTHLQAITLVSVSQLIFFRLQPPSSFFLIITAMRKAKRGGRQGDNIQDALLVSRGGESERECVCDVWSPRATNGVGESQGHYVEAVRALETLPCISLRLSLCFSLYPSSHPSIQTQPGSQRHFNGSNDNRAKRVQVRHKRGKAESERDGGSWT